MRPTAFPKPANEPGKGHFPLPLSLFPFFLPLPLPSLFLLSFPAGAVGKDLNRVRCDSFFFGPSMLSASKSSPMLRVERHLVVLKLHLNLHSPIGITSALARGSLDVHPATLVLHAWTNLQRRKRHCSRLTARSVVSMPIASGCCILTRARGRGLFSWSPTVVFIRTA